MPSILLVTWLHAAVKEVLFGVIGSLTIGLVYGSRDVCLI